MFSCCLRYPFKGIVDILCYFRFEMIESQEFIFLWKQPQVDFVSCDNKNDLLERDGYKIFLLQLDKSTLVTRKISQIQNRFNDTPNFMAVSCSKKVLKFRCQCFELGRSWRRRRNSRSPSLSQATPHLAGLLNLNRNFWVR